MTNEHLAEEYNARLTECVAEVHSTLDVEYAKYTKTLEWATKMPPDVASVQLWRAWVVVYADLDRVCYRVTDPSDVYTPAPRREGDVVVPTVAVFDARRKWTLDEVRAQIVGGVLMALGQVLGWAK